jgi:hypothetical protein
VGCAIAATCWTPLTPWCVRKMRRPPPAPLHDGRAKVLGGTRGGAPFPDRRRGSPGGTSDYGRREAARPGPSTDVQVQRRDLRRRLVVTRNVPVGNDQGGPAK